MELSKKRVNLGFNEPRTRDMLALGFDSVEAKAS